jgi:hypothetical protein
VEPLHYPKGSLQITNFSGCCANTKFDVPIIVTGTTVIVAILTIVAITTIGILIDMASVYCMVL